MKGRTVKGRTEERKEEGKDRDRGLRRRRRKTMKKRREELEGEKRKVRKE